MSLVLYGTLPPEKRMFMKTIISNAILLLFVSVAAWGTNETQQDTIRTYLLDEVVVTSSYKETNPMQTLPGSVSILSASSLEDRQVNNVKSLSAVIPNFFIPDYGSKMTAPVFIRGIGNRSAGQAISLYVDHAPYLNKSTFDFEFSDIQRVEVLRGPQGSLFGRNSMGGVIHIFTPSSLQKQGSQAKLSVGNYGFLRAEANHAGKLRENLGLSVGGYYMQRDGYFTNVYKDEDADDLQSAGGKIRLDWKITPRLSAYYLFNYDYTDQHAFPYGLYENGTTRDVNYNDAGSYRRNLMNNVLHLEYRNRHLLLSSATSYQYLDDDMKMDQDFTPSSDFTLRQQQEQNTFTQEFNVKSNDRTANYQWSFGMSGFTTDLSTDALVEIKAGGLASIQEIFDRIPGPAFTITNDMVSVPGVYDTPNKGVAIYHQSTYNNLFTERLSVTAGVRLDYEKTNLLYNAQGGMNLNVFMAATPPRPEINQNISLDSIVSGSENMDFIEILPKVSVKYEFDKKNYMYATISKGYNPGGYNVQVFSDLVKKAMMVKAKNAAPASAQIPLSSITIEDASYKSEYSWNYEVGFKGELIKDMLFASIALYYINTDNMQLTKFIDSGEGRMLANVGKAVNKGVELNLNAKLTTELFAGASYGFTHATFDNYNDDLHNYSGNYLPYVPQQTFSVHGSYLKKIDNSFIDSFSCHAQYNGAGKIYWTEANDISQNFYGTLDLKAGVGKDFLSLNVWAKNLLDANYNAFYFESMQKAFFQKGRPLTFGADLVLSF